LRIHIDPEPGDPRYDPKVMPLTPKPVRVAIVGSRDFPYEDMVNEVVYGLPRNAIIVSGGAKGVDTWAEKTAIAHRRDTDIYLPEWGKYGRRAGFIRNNLIVKNCDMLVAFWHNKSKGTKHSIDLCKYHDIPHIIVETGG
jgi:hypothetical protein